MYEQISQLLMYGDLDQASILLKIGEMFARYEQG